MAYLGAAHTNQWTHARTHAHTQTHTHTHRERERERERERAREREREREEGPMQNSPTRVPIDRLLMSGVHTCELYWNQHLSANIS